MKYFSIPAFASAMLLASCGGQSKTADNSQTELPQPDIQCMWYIENVVINDTLFARPSDIDPERNQSFTFDDGSFGVNTNCNTLGGEYVLKGDSISFTNIMTTEMACDNEQVERLVMRILPEVRTVDCVNDSTLRLNTDSTAYILLKKAPFAQKCREPNEAE